MGSHEEVVRAVLEGAADVGATFVYLDAKRGIQKRSGWGRERVQVIAHAGPIPADVVAADLAPAGDLALDWSDEITAGACVTKQEGVAA